ncbi:MAG TPA: carbon-nitrogen family hydrolase [Thermoguttaceae bacterium]|nr:carbon-nitrogen family hydrolase [Thermoguttaceae bacterium]
MQIIGVQLDIVWEDKRANFEQVDALLAKTEIEPDSLIVLPEMFATGFSMNVATVCEDETRPTGRFLAELAQKHRAYVLGGLVEQAADGRGRNLAVAFDPSGHEIARYCKLHPFSMGGEAEHYLAGDRPVVFPWCGFTVGPLVCYDLRFPEVFRHAVAMGADLLAVIACWPEVRESHWIALLKVRAIENQAYVIGVNRTGSDPRLTYSGRSLIVDPQGEVLADAGNLPGTIRAKLDQGATVRYRRSFPALQDIRPEYRTE